MKTDIAILAAGCFWGVQHSFDQVPGVLRTLVGYTGGRAKNPTYEDVCDRATGHAEAVRIEYDPAQVTYEQLLRHFFCIHDPTQLNQQGPNVGDQYRSVIFYCSDQQRHTAQAVREELMPEFANEIVTTVVVAIQFYVAEDYHQKFVNKTGRGSCWVAYDPPCRLAG